ncbi:hypothetical protein LCGC14_1283050 [marine sediment metagenome]|uniref:Uncharacterized protein n=1 Tax=marine sediment metagenome TaxID=412755 RepID=A0A0F9LFR6_9ZZZZ
MDKQYWIRVGKKLVENLLSIKVWVIFIFLIVSTKLLMMGLLTAVVWGSVNGGVISSVLAVREAMKVAKIKSDDDTEDMMV